MLFLFFFFFTPQLGWTNFGQSDWDTSGMKKNLQATQSIQAVKEDCNISLSAASIVNVMETLEETDQSRRKTFICTVKEIVEKQNQEIQKDREFIMNYIKNRVKNPNSLSSTDHFQMTRKMIKYRLLRDKEWKEYFVPSTLYTPPEEVKRQIDQLAEQHIKDQGPPGNCFFIKGKKVKKVKINSPVCHQEILYKIQKIPSQLILTQAALESGWGTSNLAKEENNILGLQVAFRDPLSMDKYPNCRRAKGDFSRCLLKFDDLSGAVYEYFSRFNGSHLKGYRSYRTNRLKLYRQGKDYDDCRKSSILSNSIDFYAENKMYINEIKKMIGKVCSIAKDCNKESMISENRSLKLFYSVRADLKMDSKKLKK